MKILSLLICVQIGYSQYASVPKTLEIDEDGGYVGLVIGISNTVAQDYSLPKLISEKIASASETLYEAAEGRVYIKKITIVAPGNWERPTENEILRNELNYKGVVTGLNFDQLPMQVYHAVEKDPLPMYTVKITPCGYRGRYMRATDNYLRKLDDPLVIKKRGTFDKVWVYLTIQSDQFIRQ